VSVSALETIAAVVNASRISGFPLGPFPVLSPLCLFIVRAGLKCTKGKVFSFLNSVKECQVCKLTPCVRTQVVWGHPSGNVIVSKVTQFLYTADSANRGYTHG